MKLKKTNLIFILISMMLLITLSTVTNLSLNMTLLVAGIVIAFMIGSWMKVTKRFDFYIIFILCCALFYFGQYIVHFITGENITRWMSITENFSPKRMCSTSIFILQCMLAMHIAVLSFYKGSHTRGIGENITCNVTTHNKAHKLAATVMFIITYSPAMLIGVYKVALTATMNYSDLLGYEVSIFGGVLDKVLRLLAGFSTAAFLYVIVSFKGSKRIRFFCILIALYCAIYYLSGSRLRVTLFIIIATLMYNDLFHKISGKQVLKLIPIGLILLLIISGVGSVRSSFSSYHSLVDIIQAIFTVKEGNNLLYSFLNEFGMTAVVVANVMEHCPRPMSFIYGKSYLFAFLYLIPNFFRNEHSMIKAVDTDLVFHSYINKYSGVGSSFIAEAYHNFGYGALIVCFIYGTLLAYLMNRLVSGGYKKDVIRTTMVYYILSQVLFSVRSDLYSIVRETVYAWVLISALYLLSVKITKSRA